MIDKDFVSGEFFEFEWIENIELREKCKQVLVDALNEGGWTAETARLCPIAVSEMKPECPSKNFEHIHEVVYAAKMIVDYMLPRYKDYIECDRDIVIAAALIHDAGKFMEYTYRDGAFCYSDSAKYLRHPLAGALLAAKYDLPQKLIHAVATHSFEGHNSYKSLEAKILHIADEVSWDYVAWKYHV